MSLKTATGPSPLGGRHAPPCGSAFHARDICAANQTIGSHRPDGSSSRKLNARRTTINLLQKNYFKPSWREFLSLPNNILLLSKPRLSLDDRRRVYMIQILLRLGVALGRENVNCDVCCRIRCKWLVLPFLQSPSLHFNMMSNVAPGISIMMIDPSLSKRTLLIYPSPIALQSYDLWFFDQTANSCERPRTICSTM